MVPTKAEKKILAVDDEEGIYEICKRSLTRKGYSVRTALSGEEAIDLLKTESFDLALTDLRMPGIDGFELLPVIRQLCPHTPVIVISAETTLQVAVECLAAGALDYVLKPFDLTELLNRIEHAFANGAAIRAAHALHYDTFEKLTKQIEDIHSKEDVLRLIVENAIQTLQSNVGCLFESRPGDGTLALAHAIGARLSPAEAREFADCMTVWVHGNEKPLVHNGHLNEAKAFRHLALNTDFSSTILIPMVRFHRLLGVLTLHRDGRETRNYSEQDRETASYFALYAELILQLQYQNTLRRKS